MKHKKQKVNIAVHGGAGNIDLASLSKKTQKGFKDNLIKALKQGLSLLQNGSSAEDAVVKAVMVLEDCVLFNAGRGSVLNAKKKISMDAALVIGDKRYGAVIGASTVRNPILLCQSILHKAPPNILAGKGADAFAKKHGIPCEPMAYFVTDERKAQQIADAKEGQVALDHSPNSPKKKFGTVGAVACDLQGEVAAATSTGGLSNAYPGRVGDSCIVGAGAFADNRSCALSATGIGEYFIKHTAASAVHFHMQYTKETLPCALEHVINKEMPQGIGGFIGMTPDGTFASSFSTKALFRAYLDERGDVVFAYS